MKKNKGGRPVGSTKDRRKWGGTTISRENFEWLQKKRNEGNELSRVVDHALDAAREAEK